MNPAGQAGLDFASDELIIDNFAGGGGASTAIERALGRPIDYAINHDHKALAMHAANHPQTTHLCEDVWDVDILKLVNGRKVGLAWFSPDCRHHSKAKGGKPVEKKIRGLAWVVLKWAGLVKPRVIGLENVEEYQQWGMVHRMPRSKRDRRRCKLCKAVFDGRPCPRHKGVTFKSWVTQLRNLGYVIEWKEIRAHQYGAGTIRKRLFVMGRRDGLPIVWPEPTHGPDLLPYRTAAECIDFSIPCPSIFLETRDAKKLRIIRPLADKTLARIAKGVQKYVIGKRRPFIVTMTHHGSARVYDPNDPIRTITGAHRGEQALVTPTLVQTGYGECKGQSPRSLNIEEPLGTIVSSGKHAVVVPTLIGVGGRSGQSRPRSGDEPAATTTSKADVAMVSTFLARYNSTKRDGNERTASVEDPLPVQPTENRFASIAVHLQRDFGKSIGSGAEEPVGTITSGGGGKTGLVAVHLAQHNTERGDGIKPGRPVDVPIATITARGTQTNVVTSNIIKLYGTSNTQSVDAPLHTITGQGLHYAEVRCFLKKYLGEDVEPVVVIDGETYIIVDIGMRMLTPRELFRCQGFPDSYIIDRGPDLYYSQRLFRKPGLEWLILTKTDQIRMCGNSVSPPPCEALIRAQFAPQHLTRSRAA